MPSAHTLSPLAWLARVITYEYPFNERTRTLLRLDDLFEKAAYFQQAEGAKEHHISLLTLFEILEVASRADLKMDLIQELERQRQTLLAFRNNPDISEQALNAALSEIESASAALLGMTGKIGQYLRENDWLMSVKSRAAIPGGVCEFDLPSYHFWLHKPADVRRVSLQEWIAPLLPLREGIRIVMRMLRSSGRRERQVAKGGAFQMMLGGSSVQMVRIGIRTEDAVIPEISANKYALNIRFTCPDGDLRPRQCGTDIPFDLVFCNL